MAMARYALFLLPCLFIAACRPQPADDPVEPTGEANAANAVTEPLPDADINASLEEVAGNASGH